MPQVSQEKQFCKRWTPEELLPKAHHLASVLRDCPSVTGVALTGSLARFEKLIHDIDLIVLHDNMMPDGSCEDPPRIIGRYSTPDLDLDFTVGRYIAKSLSGIRGDVSVNYIFVHEKALWDCRYLQSLEHYERFPGFYLAVFCQIPLILFFNSFQKGGLAQFTDAMPSVLLHEKLNNSNVNYYNVSYYSGFYVSHRCGDPGCAPKISWAEREKIIKKRKGHVWHDPEIDKNKISIRDLSDVNLRPVPPSY